jgi:uncharacterized protein YndB with AHSA1/START domain
MKWLLYVLAGVVGLVGLAVVVLLAIGGGRGEAQFDRSVEIARPASIVFKWITEPVHMKSWVAWLVDVQELTPGTSGVGARQVWVMQDRNNNNQPMNIQSEITRFESERLLEAQLSVPEVFSGTVTYQLEPLATDRTRLTYRAAFKYQHWLAKLMEPLISRSADQKLVEDLARLKQQAEAE